MYTCIRTRRPHKVIAHYHMMCDCVTRRGRRLIYEVLQAMARPQYVVMMAMSGCKL